LVTLDNKLNFIKRNIKDSTRTEEVLSSFKLLRNEIPLELKRKSRFKYNDLDNLCYEKFNKDVIKSTKTFFDEVRDYYKNRAKAAGKEKDKIRNSLQKTKKERQAFVQLQQDYVNETLKDFVRNKDAKQIVEYKNRLYQKIDPIYQDPENKFISAQFYAPRKAIFGTFISTFWMNLIVIWIYTISLIIALYYRLFARIMDLFEKISEKIFGEKE
jgi:hypothetical protein